MLMPMAMVSREPPEQLHSIPIPMSAKILTVSARPRCSTSVSASLSMQMPRWRSVARATSAASLFIRANATGMIAAILMSSVLRSGAEAGGKNYNVRNIVFVKSSGGPKEITILLKAWGAGDQGALNRLTPLVYDELRRMARRYMRRERAGNTLQTTALINEAYLRLVDAQSVDWQDRVHFFAVSAKVMRRILVDAARARGSAKRGGLVIRVDHSTAVDLDQIPEVGRSAELIALDDALNALAEIDPRKARVIELRFFGGLSVEETGGVLGISPQSVLRDWKLAKVWLIREMAKGGGRRSADRRE